MRSGLKSGQDFTISRGMEAGERVLMFTATNVSKDERQDHRDMEWGILSA